jgi:hypothetical protein
MPTLWAEPYENLSPLARAWTAHYVAKGCHPVKAARVAWDRIHKGRRTWP